jgi:putative mRNA 3-end processing factor
MSDESLVRSMPAGLYCEAGQFYVDPWQPVAHAVITHAHGDHACAGCDRYLTAAESELVLRARLGSAAIIETLRYGESLTVGNAKVSFHPAGHILGSSQVRIEVGGDVCVVSGDYKTAADPTCRPLEVVRCRTFITESTFALPIYRWPQQSILHDEINAWWRANQAEGRCSLVFAYALGKAQRVLAGLNPSIGPIWCHGSVESMNAVYRASGIALPPTAYAGRGDSQRNWGGSLVLAPPSALGTPWMRKFGEVSTAFVSGWMLVRGARRRRSVDRGFALSDHADWPGLLQTIEATRAEQVLVTHGEVATLVRWLTEHGRAAFPLPTRFEGEQDGPDDPTAELPNSTVESTTA